MTGYVNLLTRHAPLLLGFQNVLVNNFQLLARKHLVFELGVIPELYEVGKGLISDAWILIKDKTS